MVSLGLPQVLKAAPLKIIIDLDKRGAECEVQDRLGHANIQNTMVYMRYTTVTRDAPTRQLFASHHMV